jgi:hypothetical protein
MLTKKESSDRPHSPAEINLRLADAWTSLVENYQETNAKNGGFWNKTNHLGLLNLFLERHNALRRTLPREYQRLEEAMVDAAVAKAKDGHLGAPMPVELDLSMLSEVEKQAACWRELVATYCRIHGRLKVDWVAWSEKDYRELVDTVGRLQKMVQPRFAATGG